MRSQAERDRPEIVRAVLAGKLHLDDIDPNRVDFVMIEDEIAQTGQGVIAEMLNLMNLEGYATGGTIHVVLNNQVGFTTLPDDSRSTRYCTDITRMPCSWRQCVTMFTGELPWLKGGDLELVMGRALCDWIGWKLPAGK